MCPVKGARGGEGCGQQAVHDAGRGQHALRARKSARPVLLRNSTLPDGEEADVLLAAGRIEALGTEASAHPKAVGAESHDLTGFTLLPAAAEPHAHLDKALLAARNPNESGDLAGAIKATRDAYPSMCETEILRRARTALAIAISHGYTAVRAHTVCEAAIGTRALRALCTLRRECGWLADLQVVAMIGMPITGDAGATQRALLDEAILLGADLIGGAPALDERPGQALRTLTSAAASAGLGVDLHIDETTDPGVLTLNDYVTEVERLGLSGRATASHCVSLEQQEPALVTELASRVARAGIKVVTLPQTNLFLQGRAESTRTPRGLTAVRALREAGVVVAAGGDNWRDPFNPLGRIDPFETAALLVAAAHLPVEAAYDAVSARARQIMGLPPVTVAIGSTADLLAIRAADLSDAVAAAAADRWVFRHGQLVARTKVTREVDPARWLTQASRSAETDRM